MAGASRKQFNRIATFNAETFLGRFTTHSKKVTSITVDGRKYHFTTKRIKFFLRHGTQCAYCGRKGTIIAIERPKNNPDFTNYWQVNLYALDQNGGQVIMNSDHVLSAYHGGTSRHDNLVTACWNCNKYKNTYRPEGKWEPKFTEKANMAMLVSELRIIDHEQGVTITFIDAHGKTYSFSLVNQLANTLIHNLEAVLQDKQRLLELLASLPEE